MIILNASGISQTLSVIPRDYQGSFTMSVRDDSTNTSVFYNVTDAVRVGNYLTFSNIFNPALRENHFFDLHLYSDYNVWNTNYELWDLSSQIWNEEVSTTDFYKDWIFCTNQTINQENNEYYQLNKDRYLSYEGYNNEYDPIFFIPTEEVYVTYNGSKNQYIVR